jgi:hypothetical protein
MRKSHVNDEFLVVLGPIISRLFTCSSEEKRVLALVLSLCHFPIKKNLMAPYQKNKITKLIEIEKKDFLSKPRIIE